MTEPLRLGIVGAGKIASQSHLPAALECPGVEVVAMIDPVVERASDALARAGCEAAAASSLDEVASKLDAAIVATPNHTHASLAVDCLEHGLHVLIEKPLANTLEEGDSIAEAAARSGRTVAVGYCTRFRPAVEFLGELLASGFFGELRRFAYQFGVVGGWASMSGFHLNREAAGGGVLVTTGTHFLDRMLSWFGMPAECSLEDDSRGGPEANAVARFSWSAFEGTARFSKTVALPKGFVLETERGVVRLTEGQRAAVELILHDRDDVVERIAPRHEKASPQMFTAQLDDFARAVREGRPPRVDVQQGLASIRLVQDLYSHRTELPEDWYEGGA